MFTFPYPKNTNKHVGFESIVSELFLGEVLDWLEIFPLDINFTYNASCKSL